MNRIFQGAPSFSYDYITKISIIQHYIDEFHHLSRGSIGIWIGPLHFGLYRWISHPLKLNRELNFYVLPQVKFYDHKFMHN